MNLPALLGVLFIGLKLAGIIAWSWVWVLAPIWIPFALALVFYVFSVILLGAIAASVRRRPRKWTIQ